MPTRFTSLTTPGGLTQTVQTNDIVCFEGTTTNQCLISLSNGDKIVHNTSAAALLVVLLALEDDFRTVTQTQWYTATKSSDGATAIYLNLEAVVKSQPIVGYPMDDFTRVELEGGRTVDITDVAASFATLLATLETETGGEGGDESYTKAASDAKYALDTIIFTAGSGLAGGGTLEAARRFDIGATSGLLSNANDVAINWITPAVSGEFVRWDGTGFVTSAT